MRAAGRTPSGETIVEVPKDELLLIFGGLIEAIETRSLAEFRARIGLPASAAEPLITKLGEIIGDRGES